MDQRINALRQYMELYRQNADPSIYATHSGFNPTPRNMNADALEYAQRMVGGEMDQGGDFYGQAAQGAPQYTAPRSVQSLAAESGFPLAPQDRTPAQRRPEVDMREMGMNYLRNLFRR